MEPLWQKNIRQIKPYIPGEQANYPDLIKLNANENPYPPSPRVQQILQSYSAEQLRLYPSSNADKLTHALAVYYGVRDTQVFVGNGSDDVLALAFQTFFCSDKPIRFPDITYSFYPVWCSLFRIPYETIPLNEDFRISSRDYDTPCGGVILPNPNAPTGIAEERAFLEDLLSHNQDCIVVIDEAYVDFGAWSCIPLLEKYENLLIVQTFSKSRSLAGVRIGAAIGNEKLISALNAVKNAYNSYTVDALASEIGVASIADHAYFQKMCDKIIATRERTAAELRALNFQVFRSQANFLFVTHPEFRAETMMQALREHHIFIRHFNAPRIENYLRITIGTDENMNTLLTLLRQLIVRE